MKDVQLLANIDQVLSKCGRPLRSQGGTVFLPIPKRFFFQANHLPGTTETDSREIYGDTVWMLRKISTVPTINELYWRLQFPSGRYLQNVERTLSQVANSGTEGYPMVPEIPCSPGDRLLVTLDDRPTNNGAGAGSVTPVSMLFSGVYLYAVNGSTVTPINPLRDAALMARYFNTPNQNILAPEIALSLANEGTPAGFADSEFVYTDPFPVNPGFAISSTGSLSTSRQVLVSAGFEFRVRRLIFNFIPTAGLSGTLTVRVRDASGYSLTNDYIEVSQFSNAPYACDWPLCPGSKLIFDYSVVDVSGTPGTFNVQCFMKGIRRKAA